MKLLDSITDLSGTPEVCAKEVLDVIPLVMRVIRRELRRHRQSGLSVAQFRALAYLDRESDASLSELAEHIGLSLPSMSKLVDGLVAQGLVTRGEDAVDRRRLVLCLTPAGQAAVAEVRDVVQAYLAKRLAYMSERQRVTVAGAMAALRPVFAAEN